MAFRLGVGQSVKTLNQHYCAGDEAKIPDIEIRGFKPCVSRVTMASQDSYPDPRPV